MRKNIGKLPHLMKREAEENIGAEQPHHAEKKIAPSGGNARSGGNTGKMTSMRQYAKKG